ncbi:MAG TPA: RNA polymerase sigma factor [Polyangia bacterium]|nr:RNA polymerase sigma factor [Polyangia bacterium]
MESDETLMAAYRAGDVRAFEQLLARHEKPVWNFLRRLAPDSATAEDLLQEVFLRVVKSTQDWDSRWKGTAKFSTWLYTIARNLCVDNARRASHRDAASMDGAVHASLESGDSGPTLHDRLADPGAPADVIADERQAAGRIDLAIAQLPADQREVFLMREVMEMPFAEIAAVVGTSEPTVKSRMRYALEKLRDALDDLGDLAGAAASSRSG